MSLLGQNPKFSKRANVVRSSSKSGRSASSLRRNEVSIPGFALTVRPRDVGVLFAGTQARGAIVVFVSNARVAMTKKGAREVRIIPAVDGGRRCASGAEQMGRHVYADRFTGEL